MKEELNVCLMKGKTLLTNCWRQILSESGICYATQIQNEMFGLNDNSLISLIENTDYFSDVGFSFHDTNKNYFEGRQYHLSTNISVSLYPPWKFSLGLVDPFPMSYGRYQSNFKFDVRLFEDTTDDFKKMNPSQRKCYFPDEHFLQYFEQYSQSNCLLESAWNDTENVCGCIPWYLIDNKDPNTSYKV